MTRNMFTWSLSSVKRKPEPASEEEEARHEEADPPGAHPARVARRHVHPTTTHRQP